MALTKPYFWVYDPSYYSTKQLHLFTNLLKNDVDITRLEKDKVSVRQLEALLVASNKNFDVAQFMTLPQIPSASVIEFIANNSAIASKLLMYLTPDMNLNTLRWVATWVDTPYASGLSKLLELNLNWAQLEALSKIYKTYIDKTNNNQAYLNPRCLAERNVDPDTIDRVKHIFDTQHLDITKYLDTQNPEVFKDITFAVYLGVPDAFIKDFALGRNHTLIHDATDLVFTYGQEQFTKFYKQILRNRGAKNLGKALSRATKLATIHTKHRRLFAQIDSKLSLTIVQW